MEKKMTALRVIFAFLFVLYIALALVSVLAFDIDGIPEIAWDISAFGRTLNIVIVDAMPASQAFLVLFPIYFFVISLLFAFCDKKQK